MFVTSSSDSAGSSDADFSDGDVLELNTKGEIIKEGFLMKKVIHAMHLTSSALRMHYCDIVLIFMYEIVICELERSNN